MYCTVCVNCAWTITPELVIRLLPMLNFDLLLLSSSEVEVFFIDSGASGRVRLSNVCSCSTALLFSSPAQALQCTMAGVEPVSVVTLCVYRISTLTQTHTCTRKHTLFLSHIHTHTHTHTLIHMHTERE